MHKAGWLANARHDNGIVALRGRRVRRERDDVAVAAADELAGRVALSAFARFAG